MMDSRRFCGPEDAFTWKRGNKTGANSKQKTVEDAEEASPSFCPRVGVLSAARGSAYLEVGSCKVLASVYGPREIPRR